MYIVHIHSRYARTTLALRSRYAMLALRSRYARGTLILWHMGCRSTTLFCVSLLLDIMFMIGAYCTCLTLLLLVPFSYKLMHHLKPFAIVVLNGEITVYSVDSPNGFLNGTCRSWPSGLAYRTQVLVLAAECGFESRP